MNPFKKVCEIKIKNHHFVITESPTDENINEYVNMLTKKNIIIVVRCCHSPYNPDPIVRKGIKVVDLIIPDGLAPSKIIVEKWKQIVKEYTHGTFAESAQIYKKGDMGVSPKGSPPIYKTGVMGVSPKGSPPPIAVHCQSGLGRAPLLVALAIINTGVAPVDAIDIVRKHRPMSLNNYQLNYLIDNHSQKVSLCSCNIL